MRICSLCLCVVLSIGAGTLSGCTGGQTLRPYRVSAGGNQDRGQLILMKYRCGSCHTIPGIRDAHGVFGPPLTSMASRSFIAGEFPNMPDNLVRWIMSPTSMKPKTAMPDLGLSEQDSRDAAAYLYTLR
jgi:cytochrome c